MSVRPIRAGKLRNRIVIQSRTFSRTAQGGNSPTWSTLATVWASIEPKSGREFFFSDAIRAQATHYIQIRAYSSTITPDMRITWGSRTFNIINALRVDEIQHEVIIAATEVL